MTVGSIAQDRYAIKWVPGEKRRGILSFTPFVKGIKLTSLSGSTTVRVFYCEPCGKFIINRNDVQA